MIEGAGKMENKEKLIELIKAQIEVEKENIKQVDATEKKIDNAAAKISLLEIRVDSQKHADILKGILDFLQKTPSAENIWQHRLSGYVDPFVVKKELENHEKRESRAIELVQNEIKHTRDEGLRLLLQNILDDEKKHHKMLETIIKHLPKMES